MEVLKPVIIEEEPITILELKQDLAKLKKKLGELDYRANKAESYVEKVLKLKKSQHDELKKQLMSANISRLKPKHVAMIINLLPRSVEQLKAYMHDTTLKDSDLKKIVDIVKSVLGD